MSKRFKNLEKLVDNKYASIVADGTISDMVGFTDTGSYALNAVLSGSIFGGLPNNKVTAFAGEEATGKTYFCLGVIKNFLENNPDAEVVIFESEASVTKDIIESRGIDSSRILLLPVATIQEFATQCTRIVQAELDTPEEDRAPMLIVLDSLGMLSTTKEIEDIESGSGTKDMTRAQLIKGAFRALTLKLGLAKIPLLITNHTYQGMGMFATKSMSGGSGLKFAASSVLFLSKAKDKDGRIMTGSRITCTAKKSRIVREGSMTTSRLTHEHGLDRYYGLVDIAIAGGVFKKISKKVQLPDGTTEFQKTIDNNPEKYFTDEILKQIDEAAKKIFHYGATEEDEIVEEILNGSE